MTTSENIFLPDYDDNEIIYWEDDWVYYKFPNKITEKNKHKAECFDAYNNSFVDFSWKTADEIANYCFEYNYSFWREIWMSEYDNARNGVLERQKQNS